MKTKVNKLPRYLYRHDDGERFTLKNNFYTMDSSVMVPKYRYTYEQLINHNFVASVKDCNIVTYKSNNTGHGDFEDESC